MQGDPNGQGRRHPSERRQGQTCWPFKGVTGIEKPTMAHIRQGVEGHVRPRRRPVRDELQGVWLREDAESTIETIETNPNAYYVNVHNAEYPAGALRGQLVARDGGLRRRWFLGEPPGSPQTPFHWSASRMRRSRAYPNVNA